MAKSYNFIRELREQPAVVRETLAGTDEQLRELAIRYAGRIDRIVLTGCGDPYMLSIAAVIAFERWLGIPSEAIEAAEFTGFRGHLVNDRTLVILISSSGKTVKVLDAERIVRRLGAPTLALTNLVPSPLADQAEVVVQTRAGWSDSFPTKQTTTALSVLYSLALHWAECAGALPAGRSAALRQELCETVPAKMEQALSLADRAAGLARQYRDAPIFTFIGSGSNLSTALLGAAKIKETSQSRAEATNLEEYAHLHGLSLGVGDPVFIITHPGRLGARNRAIARWIVNNGGSVIAVGPAEERGEWSALEVEYVEVPDHDEMFGPLVSLLPLQLFAYSLALEKGRNPDKPPARGDIGALQEVIYTSMLEGWNER